MIYKFQEIGRNDLPLVGGKGANLGELTKAGFPVPPGFCLTTKAYKLHLREGGIESQIESLLKNPDSAGGETIKQMILEAPLPQKVTDTLSKAFGDLGNTPLAVRSSATAEDLPDASFAGQQESFLGVKGLEELLEAVKKCWASLWNNRAVAYRNRMGYSHKEVSLGVVIQQLISAELSGVLFTVNPVTGNKKEMMVNASYGLGELLVSGRITPDTYLLGRNGRLISKAAGSKERQLLFGEDGEPEECDVPADLRPAFVLNQEMLNSLHSLGLSVERHFRSPQDVEWAFFQGKFFLLQSRPVTGLNQSRKKRKIYKGLRGKILDNILEHCPDPPYPLDFRIVVELQELKHALYRELGFRIGSAEKEILMDHEGLPWIHPRLPLPTHRIFKVLKTVKAISAENKEGVSGRIIGQLTGQLKGMEHTDISGFPLPALAGRLEKLHAHILEWGKLRFRYFIMPMIFLGKKLGGMIQKFYKEEKIFSHMLLSDLEYKTMLIDRDLHSLAELVNRTPRLKEAIQTLPMEKAMEKIKKIKEGGEFLGRWTKFLMEHGARTMKVFLPFSNFSWREKPEILFSLFSSMLRGWDNEGVFKHKGSRNYHGLVEKITEAFPAAKQDMFRGMLTGLRKNFTARELTLYRIEEAFLLARETIKKGAEILLVNEWITEERELLFLTLEELLELFRGRLAPENVKAVISERMKARKGAAESWSPVHRTHSKGLKGLAGSGGTVRGCVKIISTAEEFHKLSPGDILVCPYTDPSWTPLFTLAGGIIANTGGPLSHAAIVAREYGIPAVLGIPDATGILKDGEMVTVDGNTGIVIREE